MSATTFQHAVQPNVPLRCENCGNVGMQLRVEYDAELEPRAEGGDEGTATGPAPTGPGLVIISEITEVRGLELSCGSCGGVRPLAAPST